MSSRIEFGILRPGSTNAFLGEWRVDVDDEQFESLDPVFSQIRQRTGLELDLYGADAFSDEHLTGFIACIETALMSTANADSLLLLRSLHAVAVEATQRGVPLTYMGL